MEQKNQNEKGGGLDNAKFIEIPEWLIKEKFEYAPNIEEIGRNGGLETEIKRKTEKAILVENKEKEIWLPRSEITLKDKKPDRAKFKIGEKVKYDGEEVTIRSVKKDRKNPLYDLTKEDGPLSNLPYEVNVREKEIEKMKGDQ